MIENFPSFLKSIRPAVLRLIASIFSLAIIFVKFLQSYFLSYPYPITAPVSLSLETQSISCPRYPRKEQENAAAWRQEEMVRFGFKLLIKVHDQLQIKQHC